MAESIFITGGSGFIGRRLLPRLVASGLPEVVALSRAGGLSGLDSVDWVRGDLLNVDSYAERLNRSTTVLHMAAATGKASPEDFERTNVAGTGALLSACKTAGIRRFVMVSSIAARYADLGSYPYGKSKRAAEQLVQQSGLPYVIVRPTVVLGRESPVWQRFRQLGRLSVIPLLGSGATPLQPIHVDDLAVALVSLLAQPGIRMVIEVGGRESLTIVELLKRIHRLDHANDPRFVRIPYALVRSALSLLEPWALPYLPVTTGQLSLFVNDSTARPSNELRDLQPHMMAMDDMLKKLELSGG